MRSISEYQIKMKKFSNTLAVLILLQACVEQENAQTLVDAAISAHGFDQIEKYKISFDFRGKQYSQSYTEEGRIYTREFKDDSLGQVKDVLNSNGDFGRLVNGQKVSLDEEWKGRYSNSVNSVLYFFQLPYGLNDPAVNKKYLGKNFVNGKIYDKVQITFDEEGGGEDHEDVFVYWIHEKNKTMDFMAYLYATEGGGMRFRQAINRRKIKGMLFQDYVNYKPARKSSLSDMDELFEMGELLELSRIVNENIVVN